MNAKILILALCAFQLASGDTVNSTINQVITPTLNAAVSNINNTIAGFQSKLSTVTSQVQTGYTNASQSLMSMEQNANEKISSMNLNSSAAQTCKAQVQLIINIATKQLQSQLTSFNSTIASCNQNLNSASAAVENATTSILSNATACLKSMDMNSIPCLISVKNNVDITMASSVLPYINATTQAFDQLTGISPNTTSSTQMFQQTIQSANNQTSNALQACQTQAATAMNATTTNATTSSG